MGSKYQAYPEYKDSGVEFLGLIPRNWIATPVKHIGNLKGGAGFPHVDQGVSDQELDFHKVNALGKSNIDDLLEKSENTVSKEIAKKLGAFIFPEKTIVFAKVGAALMLARIRWLNYPACIDNNMMGLVVNKSNDSNFIRYAMNVIKFDYIVNPGAVPSLNEFQIGNMLLAIPPIIEQKQITNFLDHETAKIDTLIEKQQQLIKLLKEKRQAVISHAVTKGLNPNARMRGSGVEWLGEVPEHWVVQRLKHTSNLQSGIPKGKDLTGKISISVPMLRVANVQDGYLDLSDIHEIAIESEQLERYSLKYGDVLMNEGGDNDKLGRGAVWKSKISPCIHQNHVFAIRPYSIEPEWLDLLTRASYAKFHFYMVAKQSTNLASISSTNIKETPLVIPPEVERREIMKYILEKLDVFEKAEEKCTTQITLLQERRTALISAAVTGKIDVRDWQPPNG